MKSFHYLILLLYANSYLIGWRWQILLIEFGTLRIASMSARTVSIGWLSDRISLIVLIIYNGRQ